MNDDQLLQQVENLKRNPKLSKAMGIFEHAEKIYERTIKAVTVRQRPIQKGTYSTSISKKDYYANISTTTHSLIFI